MCLLLRVHMEMNASETLTGPAYKLYSWLLSGFLGHPGDTSTRTLASMWNPGGKEERPLSHLLLQDAAAHTKLHCPSHSGPFSLGYGKQRGSGSDVPDLNTPVHGDRSHLLAVRVKAA